MFDVHANMNQLCHTPLLFSDPAIQNKLLPQHMTDSTSTMKNGVLVVIFLLSFQLYAPGKAQQNTCPGLAGSCNCQLNNVESLRALIRSEVEAEVAARLAATPGV